MQHNTTVLCTSQCTFLSFLVLLHEKVTATTTAGTTFKLIDQNARGEIKATNKPPERPQCLQ